MQPKTEFPFFRRYFLKKHFEYTLGNDHYEVYKIRGKRKIKVKTFKNGVLLSSQQQAKAFRKYKIQNPK
ncbi:hypothetical protein D3C80_2123080 [compost metagenome]